MNLKHWCLKQRTKKMHDEERSKSQVTAQNESTSVEQMSSTKPDYDAIADAFANTYEELTKKHHSVFEVVKMYKQMLFESHISESEHEECMNILAEVTAVLFESLIYGADDSSDEDEEEQVDVAGGMTFLEIEQEIITALYIISQEYEFDFITLFDFLYAETVESEVAYWSFDAFAKLPVLAKEYGYTGMEEAIKTIWNQYLFEFIEFASEESMQTLANNEYDSWGTIIYNRLKDESYHDELSDFSLDVLIGAIPIAFPELIADAYETALLISLEGRSDSEMMHHFKNGILPYERLDRNTSMTMYLLNKMADYTKYTSVTFSLVREIWDSIIIELVVNSKEPSELDEAINLFVDVFGIPKKEVVDFIACIMHQFFDDMKVENVSYVAKLLCNKYAFGVASKHKPEFIKAFTD